MKQFSICICEQISQNFLISADSKEEAIQKAKSLYQDSILVVDQGNLVSTELKCDFAYEDGKALNGPEWETNWEKI